MKRFIALILFGAIAHLCSAFDAQKLASARYGRTGMAAAGAASIIRQIFYDPSSDLQFHVWYQNGPQGSKVLLVLSDDEVLDVRKDPALVKALRTVLCAYLASEDRNERAAVDVSSALCVLNEPSVDVFSLMWLGSSGRCSPELGKIETQK